MQPSQKQILKAKKKKQIKSVQAEKKLQRDLSDRKKSNKTKAINEQNRVVKFIKSAVLAKDYPVHQGFEIAFVGRSNAGKSSLINLICGTQTAKVSQTPGKTRLINFFDFKGSYILVDVPGYGYAVRDKAELESWKKMMDVYLSTRRNLRGLVIVMDIRRDWTEEEQNLKDFLQNDGRPTVIAATKYDKIGKNEIKIRVQALAKQSQGLEVFPVSSLDKNGHKELENYIFHEWIKAN